MQLDGVLLYDVVLRQECADVLALITLQLENLAELFVLHNATVAAIFCTKRRA